MYNYKALQFNLDGCPRGGRVAPRRERAQCRYLWILYSTVYSTVAIKTILRAHFNSVFYQHQHTSYIAHISKDNFIISFYDTQQLDITQSTWVVNSSYRYHTKHLEIVNSFYKGIHNSFATTPFENRHKPPNTQQLITLNIRRLELGAAAYNE